MLSTIDHNSYAIKKLLRRKNFGRVTTTTKIPNLIQTQKESYNDFLQMDVPPHKRENKGLEGIFRFVFPLSDFENKASLEYVRYNLFKPKYDLQECTQRGINYSASLSLTVRLVIWETGDEGEKEINGKKRTLKKTIKDYRLRNVDLDAVEAKIEDGVLSIYLKELDPKTKEKKRQISLN